MAQRHLARHGRTVAVIRYLRALGPLPRRRKLPRQLQPDAIRREYFNALIPIVDVARRAWHAEQQGVLAALRALMYRQGKLDASDDGREARRAVDRAARAAADRLRFKEVGDVAAKFGRRTSEFQQEQLDRQVRAALSVPLSAVERPITEKLNEFAATNVDLIRTVPERYFDRIRAEVQEAFETGESPTTLADRLAEIDDTVETDTMRIARDQIGKLNAEFNQERQEAMGVEGYIWRTANDNRVRDEHAEREGEHFDWDDPPEDGHPGEPIQCRCFAEPDFGPVLEGIREETDA